MTLVFPRHKRINISESCLYDDARCTSVDTQYQKRIAKFPEDVKKIVARRRQQIAAFMKNATKKSYEGMQEELKSAPDNPKPLLERQVELREPWPSELSLDAVWISTPLRAKRFIVTGRPEREARASFWFMCIQERVENVVTLGAFPDYTYVPTEDDIKEMVFEACNMRITVKLESEQYVKTRDYKKARELNIQRLLVRQRRIVLKGPLGGDEHRLTHYHTGQWDASLPIPYGDVTLLKVLSLIRASEGPILIQAETCESTGFLILLEVVMERLMNGLEIGCLDQYLVELRKQRPSLLKNEHEYLSAQMILTEYFGRLYLLTSEENSALFEFSKPYRLADRLDPLLRALQANPVTSVFD